LAPESITINLQGKSNTLLIEGLEVKLPEKWTDEKKRWEETEKRKAEGRRSEKRKSQKKEDACARKGKKWQNTVFSQGFGAQEGREAKNTPFSEHFWKLSC